MVGRTTQSRETGRRVDAETPETMTDPALVDAAAAVVRCWNVLYPDLAFALGGEENFTRTAVAVNRLRAAVEPAPPWRETRPRLDGETG